MREAFAAPAAGRRGGETAAHPDARAWGIETSYTDGLGRQRRVPRATVAALLEAMGADSRRPPTSGGPLVVGPGERPPLAAPALLALEEGGELLVEGELPPDVPPGYHSLLPVDGGDQIPLIVHPGRCHPPDHLDGWGWAVQLPAVRSVQSWGIGDLSDLRELAAGSRSLLGASFLMLGPIHAPLPGVPQQPSPYSPSSRRFRNPLLVRPDEVPWSPAGSEAFRRLAERSRRLLEQRRIDRDAVHRLKLAALEDLWERFPGAAAFDAYRAREGDTLERYATFCVLCERLGRGWRRWPERLRSPDAPDVAGFAREHLGRVRFHQWLQWLLDTQLADAGAELPLIGDLAVGVDRDGADAWLDHPVVADGLTVGAPPDEFNRQGQVWGVSPFDPWRLRRTGYRPFAEAIRCGLRHAGGLRVDHVMGLFRLFLIPPGGGPEDGAYVRYPADDLLGVLALESARARASVVGEDLGTVGEGVRERLRRAGVLSYRLLWFEDGPPSELPGDALAAVTTHDLPTVAGLWTGADLEAQRRLGLVTAEESAWLLRERLRRLAAVEPGARRDEVAEGVHRALAGAPCRLRAAQLEDALGVTERPNMPGTTDGWPNWSLALPLPLGEVIDDPRVRRVAAALRR